MKLLSPGEINVCVCVNQILISLSCTWQYILEICTYRQYCLIFIMYNCLLTILYTTYQACRAQIGSTSVTKHTAPRPFNAAQQPLPTYMNQRVWIYPSINIPLYQYTPLLIYPSISTDTPLFVYPSNSSPHHTHTHRSPSLQTWCPLCVSDYQETK